MMSFKKTCHVCSYSYNPVLPECPECNHEKNIKYNKEHTYLFVDRNIGYYDHQLGMQIDSTHQLRKVMKERGLEGVHSFSEIKQKPIEQQKEECKVQIRNQILKKSEEKRTLKLAS